MELKPFTEHSTDLAQNSADIAGLDALRKAAHSGDNEALNKAAEEFEAIFVRMMLKSMRQAQDVLADENSPMNSQHMKFYRDMHDQQIASDLASGEGLGLAELIVQQLGPQQQGFMPSSVIRTDGNLPFIENAPTQKIAGFEDKEAFIEELRPVITPIAEKLNIEPNALLAQAALETGWGQHMIHDVKGTNSHNLFGIKAQSDWSGSVAKVPTLEYQNGVAKRQTAAFKAYDSLASSADDYFAFLQQHHYQQARASTAEPAVFFAELQKAGYATDPNYANKITSIMARLD